MDLNELLVFTRVVQTGSFTAAAKKLGMPKSTVSRKVSDLEQRVGTRLLQRTTRKLGLTDAGRIYFERASRIVAEVEEADQEVGSMHAEPRGLLRVTVPLSFEILAPVIAEYLAKYPDVQVEMLCTDRRVDLVDEGFDVAVRAGSLEDSTLIARRLAPHQRILVASPAYLKKRGVPKKPEDLSKHACVSFGIGTTALVWRLKSGEQERELRITPRLAVNDFNVLRGAVLGGLGIASIPYFVCAEDLKEGRMRRVLSDWASTETPLHAVYPSARHLAPKVSAFVELLRDRLGEALAIPS